MKTDFSYSLSVEPAGFKISEIHTILISCSEPNSSPTSKTVEKLMPLAHLAVPAGLLARVSHNQRSNAADFLPDLLSSGSGVANIVVCLHTGCSLMKQVLDREIFRIDDSVLALGADSRSVNEGEIMLLQKTIKIELRDIQKQLRRDVALMKRKVKFQGWVFEPEIDWVSFYDIETGLLLPLSFL